MVSKVPVQNLPFEMRIVDMKPEHVAQVAQIGEKSGFHFWNEDDYRKEVENKDALCLVVIIAEGIKKNSVIGYSLTRLMQPEAEILNIAIDDIFRKQGIGTSLLDKTIAELHIRNFELVWLEVRASNTAAKSIYVRRGFSLVGTRKSYYSNPVEDAELMLYKCNTG